MRPQLLLTLIALAIVSLPASLAHASDQEKSAAKPGEKITFSEHIAPILFNNCVECHREGESAPFSLMNYEDARRRARTMAKTVGKRYMPPWIAIGGDIPLMHERRLTDEQIALIETWAENGAPEGDPKLLPDPPVFPDGWRLGEPDLVLEMPEAYTLPAEGPDIYRNFVIPSGLTQDRWLKAIEFKPGSPSVVHHCLFHLDTTGEARKAEKQDTSAPGFAEMPLGSGIGRSLGGWVPGSTPLPLPDGMSHHLPAGSDIILATHFHLSGKVEKERSKIALYFDDKPAKKQFTALQLPPIFGAFAGIDIAPGAPEATITDTFELPVAIEAFGATAHAHYLGKSLRLTAELPNGEKKILLNIPEWDFAWQEDYRFQENIRLPKGTKLTSVVTWDNTRSNPHNPAGNDPVRVRWGRESFDEMGSLILLVTADTPRQLKTLRRALSEHLQWQAGSHIVSPEKLKFAADLRQNALHKFDTDQDGKLSAEEKTKAEAYLQSDRGETK